MNIAVTIARAIELKHKPSIVSALAYETSRMYQDAGQTLTMLVKFYIRLVCWKCLLDVFIHCIEPLMIIFLYTILEKGFIFLADKVQYKALGLKMTSKTNTKSKLSIKLWAYRASAYCVIWWNNVSLLQTNLYHHWTTRLQENGENISILRQKYTMHM